ncbi:hypothetical protein MMC09_000095 [Bachmanniomyces sp. S44760]|nr:hypothetical protein [Bachmanniomyces sp. S44760]
MTNNPLKNCVVAVTGEFGEDKGAEQIKRWVEVNGGTFVTRIAPDVTHLVCSKEHYRRRNKMVRDAQKVKTLKIVTFDWLEDSLQDRSPKRIYPYLMESCNKATSERKAKKHSNRRTNIERGVESFKNGCADFIKRMGTEGYHVYYDHTGFNYDVILVRADLTTNQNERCSLKVGLPHSTRTFPYRSPRRPRVPLGRPRTQRLQMFQNHVAPLSYACHVNYSSPTKGNASQILAPVGSSFETTISSFKKFFELKTGIEWDHRDLDSDVKDETAFVYSAPKGREPRGIFPS